MGGVTPARTALATAVMLLLAAPRARAVPRFALRTGTTCGTCHVNPSGGAMRNAFGRNVFVPTRLAWSPGSLPPAAETEPALAVGADVRIVHLGVRPGPDDRTADGARGAFFPMQADGYASVSHGRMTGLVDFGLLGSWEAMVMATVGPLSFKAGRFMLPYGLRLDNHTVFTREPLGFGARDKDVGFEVGGSWQGQRVQLHLQASATNGAGGDVLIDDNRDKAATARAELFVRPLAPTSAAWLVLLAGGSAHRNVTGEATATREGRVVHDRVGAFGGVALGRFTLLGEADLAVDDELGAAPARDGRLVRLASFVELGAVIRRGLEAQVLYEFHDLDIDVTPNARHRLGVMIEIFPSPLWAIHALVRATDAPRCAPDRQRVESMLQLHLYL